MSGDSRLFCSPLAEILGELHRVGFEKPTPIQVLRLCLSINPHWRTSLLFIFMLLAKEKNKVVFKSRQCFSFMLAHQTDFKIGSNSSYRPENKYMFLYCQANVTLFLFAFLFVLVSVLAGVVVRLKPYWNSSGKKRNIFRTTKQ